MANGRRRTFIPGGIVSGAIGGFGQQALQNALAGFTQDAQLRQQDLQERQQNLSAGVAERQLERGDILGAANIQQNIDAIINRQARRAGQKAQAARGFIVGERDHATQLREAELDRLQKLRTEEAERVTKGVQAREIESTKRLGITRRAQEAFRKDFFPRLNEFSLETGALLQERLETIEAEHADSTSDEALQNVAVEYLSSIDQQFANDAKRIIDNPDLSDVEKEGILAQMASDRQETDARIAQGLKNRLIEYIEEREFIRQTERRQARRDTEESVRRAAISVIPGHLSATGTQIPESEVELIMNAMLHQATTPGDIDQVANIVEEIKRTGEAKGDVSINTQRNLLRLQQEAEQALAGGDTQDFTESGPFQGLTAEEISAMSPEDVLNLVEQDAIFKKIERGEPLTEEEKSMLAVQ